MLPRVRRATWKTAALAGQLTWWTASVCEHFNAGWLGAFIIAFVFLAGSVYWVGGREMVDGVLGRRAGSWAEANELMGRVGGRMLVWVVSGAIAIIVQVAYTWPPGDS